MGGQNSMGQKIQLNQDQLELLKMGTAIHINGGSRKYYYLPFWFVTTEEEGIYEILTFENLPKELTDFIQKEREYATRRDNKGK